MKILLSLSSTAILLGCMFTVHAQTTSFTYQGKLTDTVTPQAATYDLEFALYTSGGTIVGSPIQRNGTPVTNGVFTVTLDFGENAFVFGDERRLEIRIKRAGEPSYTPLTPRQSITSAPYAIRARSAATADNVTGSVVQFVPFLGGAIANVPPSPNWVFLGGPANVGVSAGDLLTVTGSATLGHTTSTLIPVSINLCYRSGAGSVIPLRAEGEDLVDIDLMRANFTINYASVSLPAGTYDIGFCARNESLGTLNQNGKATGWVMKYK